MCWHRGRQATKHLGERQWMLAECNKNDETVMRSWTQARNQKLIFRWTSIVTTTTKAENSTAAFFNTKDPAEILTYIPQQLVEIIKWWNSGSNTDRWENRNLEVTQHCGDDTANQSYFEQEQIFTRIQSRLMDLDVPYRLESVCVWHVWIQVKMSCCSFSYCVNCYTWDIRQWQLNTHHIATSATRL